MVELWQLQVHATNNKKQRRLSMQFEGMDNKELLEIDGGCAMCYVGAALVVGGAYLVGGPLGAAIAFVGVAGSLKD